MAPGNATMQGPAIREKRNGIAHVFNHFRWEHLAAGVTGGVASTLVLHPLDLIKVRFQVNEGLQTVAASRPQYQSVTDAFVKIARTEGVRGLYKGVTANVWGTGASWGLYFLFYNTVKGKMMESMPQDAVTLDSKHHMLAAAEAGMLTLTFTNPLWVAKTRLCLQYDNHISPSSVTHYKGMFDCLAKIWAEEGVRGLYRGFLPGVIGVSHGVVQFVTYEEMKKRYNTYKNVPLNATFTTVEYLTFAVLSKVLAAMTTYPYQVLRSRLQDQHQSYSGLWDCIVKIWRRERYYGFYKGLPAYLLHVTPNICIVFLIYETFTNYVINRRGGVDEEPDVRLSLRRTVHVGEVPVAVPTLIPLPSEEDDPAWDDDDDDDNDITDDGFNK